MPPELKIDKDFKKLIFPLDEYNHLRLVDSLAKNGCIDPIIIWNNTIVDGHKRYEICCKHHIHFETEPTIFDCKESAMIWICQKQLERENIPNTMRNYLIGFYYRLVKYTTGRKNRRDPDFNYTPIGKPPHIGLVPRSQKTADKVGTMFHLSAPSIRKYAVFSKTVDRIEKKVPWGSSLILSGNCKLSQEKLYDLSWESSQVIATQLQASRKRNKKKTNMKQPTQFNAPEIKPQSIKDMPIFDPDGTFTELTLTIPYWSKSIKRTLTSTDISLVSSRAKIKLLNVLFNHQAAIQELINSIKE